MGETVTVTVTETPESGGTGSEGRLRAAGLAVAVLLPLVIIGNSLLLLLIPWHADLQYAVPGFPDPPARFAEGDRSALARDGIVSIWPVGPGDRVLEEARFADGSPAFGSDEVSHMSDVRTLVGALLAVWLLAVIGMATLVRKRGLTSVQRALRIGAWSTLGVFVAVGLGSILSFDALFTSFHEALFEEGTWTFPIDSTLIGLYPERFWVTATGALVLLSVIQALVVIWWSGRSRMPE